eukprot:gene26545-509_t
MGDAGGAGRRPRPAQLPSGAYFLRAVVRPPTAPPTVFGDRLTPIAAAQVRLGDALLRAVMGGPSRRAPAVPGKFP